MPTFWDPATRDALDRRIDRLTPAQVPRWGKMNAPQMLAHLTDWWRMATGDLYVPERHLPLRYFPLKQLVINWLPFPKDLPTAPELIARSPAPEELDAERNRLRAGSDAFMARARDGAWPAHPAFGPLSGDQWGVLAYRHTDHHLRQFGV